MHEKHYSFYTISRIKKEATVLKKEKDYTQKQALDLVAKNKGFKSFNDARTQYEDWLKRIIKSEKERNKMIKLTPSDKVTIIENIAGNSESITNDIYVNRSHIIRIQPEYNKGNIEFVEGAGLFNSKVKTVDSKIELRLTGGGDYYSYIYLYFQDAQNEYHRILRELGISTNLD